MGGPHALIVLKTVATHFLSMDAERRQARTRCAKATCWC